MKKVALSKMKCAALFAMMFFSYQGMAQTASIYIGDNCKIYPTPYSGTPRDLLIAHLVTDEHNSSAKYLMADKLILLINHNEKEHETEIRTSKYGNYVEFYDVNSNSFKIFDKKRAFTKNGSSLYYVDVYSGDVGYTITTDLEIADDFQIIYCKGDYGGEFIFIKNNGILSEYNVKDIKNNTSVNSPKVDEKEDATYSVDGKKVQTPHNGIFIKGDKKVMIK